MGIDFYDRMFEEEQKEKKRFGQRKNEIEDEMYEQRKRIEELEKEIDYYKSRECHWDEIEEDAKRIAEENAELKAQLSESRKDFWRAVKNVGRLRAQIEKMQCCGNCSKRNQCEMNVIDSLHCDKWS